MIKENWKPNIEHLAHLEEQEQEQIYNEKRCAPDSKSKE